MVKLALLSLHVSAMQCSQGDYLSTIIEGAAHLPAFLERPVSMIEYLADQTSVAGYLLRRQCQRVGTGVVVETENRCSGRWDES